MFLAIPVKNNNVDSAVAPLFGKAKWFALIDENGELRFWQNDAQSGRDVVGYFRSIGVQCVVFQDMGGNPYMQLKNAGIDCYHTGHGRVLLKDAIRFFQDKALKQVTPENMAEYVERPHRYRKAEHQHLHHCGDHAHHGHHGHGHHGHAC